MRILSVTSSLGPGGLERAVQNCSIEYQRRGHDVAVVSYGPGGARAAALREAGIEVFLPDDGVDAVLGRAAAWGADVLHIQRNGVAEPIWTRILQRLRPTARPGRRIPVVETNVFARVDSSPDRHAIDVHAQLSRWCLWKWSSWARGLTPPPLGVVVPYMVHTERFFREAPQVCSDFRREYGVPDDAFLFGRIGQPNLGKWSPVMFDAFATLAQRQPRAWLLLVGLPPELRPALEALPDAARRRVALIDFLHGDEALRRCYSSMDAFVHAAMIGESFGYVLAESMLCGTPVITLNTPLKDNSQLEVVGHRRGGLVVCDAGSMAQAMNLVIDDSSLWSSLSVAGAAWVKEHYSAQRVGDQMLRVLAAARDAGGGREGGGDRERLRAALADMAMPVSKSEIRRLTYDCIGRPRRRDMLILPAVNDPRLYRLWRRLKFGSPLRRILNPGADQ